MGHGRLHSSHIIFSSSIDTSFRNDFQRRLPIGRGAFDSFALQSRKSGTRREEIAALECFRLFGGLGIFCGDVIQGHPICQVKMIIPKVNLLHCCTIYCYLRTLFIPRCSRHAGVVKHARCAEQRRDPHDNDDRVGASILAPRFSKRCCARGARGRLAKQIFDRTRRGRKGRRARIRCCSAGR